MRVKIEKSKANGKVFAPPSKSIAHRLLIACALARGESEIAGISDSEDMLATLDCIRALGISVEKSDNIVKIYARGERSNLNGEPKKSNTDKEPTFCCRESGSTLRFFIPVASVFFEKSKFEGSQRLLERGVEIYEKSLGEHGVTVMREQGHIKVCGRLESGIFEIDGSVSSQYVSGLMFALPLLEGDSEIRVSGPVESRAYIDMTIDVLKKVGIEITEKERNVFFVKGGQNYRAGKYEVEGDWSNAAMLLALNELGGKVEVCGLDENSVQGDKICKEIFARLDEKNAVIDLSDCPDLAPIAFCVAAVKNGAKFVGTRRLKIKESDRAQAMAQELLKFGIEVEVHENDVVVHKNNIKTPDCAIDGHNDHRIVMACCVLASTVGAVCDGAEAVKKSFPDFFEKLGKLGVKYEVE